MSAAELTEAEPHVRTLLARGGEDLAADGARHRARPLARREDERVVVAEVEEQRVAIHNRALQHRPLRFHRLLGVRRRAPPPLGDRVAAVDVPQQPHRLDRRRLGPIILPIVAILIAITPR
eukprot:CAMPEP_0180298164 /NCGR_PEP_ID=MMETSP0988-20121125/21069_1 /TAXON_ID=697907 /ORGANISM="non described non described, Strain CCMP2293" /LENGTH=120 /DNA_ID=CAMNT_0022277157 /DNA_START=323 /DNA_END=680 /DNA_ORIENTATION=+